MKRVILCLLMAVFVAFGLASPAQASAGNRVCNNSQGTYTAYVQVWEIDGSVYNLYPGDCSPRSPGINAFRAPTGWAVYYKYEGGSTTQPLKKCAHWSGTTGYCTTNGWSISVSSVKPL